MALNLSILSNNKRVVYDPESSVNGYDDGAKKQFELFQTPDSTREDSFQFNMETYKHTGMPRFYLDFSTAVRKIE